MLATKFLKASRPNVITLDFLALGFGPLNTFCVCVESLGEKCYGNSVGVSEI